MMPNHTRVGTRRHGAMRQLVGRLLRDDSGVTSIRHFVASVGLAVAAAAAVRPIVGVLGSLLYRIHIIATLARP